MLEKVFVVTVVYYKNHFQVKIVYNYFERWIMTMGCGIVTYIIALFFSIFDLTFMNTNKKNVGADDDFAIMLDVPETIDEL